MRSVLRQEIASRGPRVGRDDRKRVRLDGPLLGRRRRTLAISARDSQNLRSRSQSLGRSTPGRVGCDAGGRGFLRATCIVASEAGSSPWLHSTWGMRAFPRSCGGTTPMTSGLWREQRAPYHGRPHFTCRRSSGGRRRAQPGRVRVRRIALDPAVDSDSVTAGPGTALSTVAQIAGCSVKEVESLNPELRSGRTHLRRRAPPPTS